MLLLFMLACQPAGDPVHALVLTGWRYEWELLSHRISLLQVGVNQDGTADLGLIGGSYTTGEDGSDTPYFSVGWADVGVPGATFVTGSAEWTIGPDPSGATTVTASAPEDCEVSAAFLNGFSINTDVPQSADFPAEYDPALGYTAQGFGFAVGEPVVSGESVEVEVIATVDWGPQDREDMNEAMTYAQTGVSASVLFVCFGGDVATGRATGSASFEHDPPYTAQTAMSGGLTVAGEAPDGVIGSTGFDLRASFDNQPEGTGEYLRSFGVSLSGQDDGDGAWTGDVSAEILTSSAIEFGALSEAFTADYARLGQRGAITEAFTMSGTHAVGEAPGVALIAE